MAMTILFLICGQPMNKEQLIYAIYYIEAIRWFKLLHHGDMDITMHRLYKRKMALEYGW